MRFPPLSSMARRPMYSYQFTSGNSAGSLNSAYTRRHRSRNRPYPSPRHFDINPRNGASSRFPRPNARAKPYSSGTTAPSGSTMSGDTSREKATAVGSDGDSANALREFGQRLPVQQVELDVQPVADRLLKTRDGQERERRLLPVGDRAGEFQCRTPDALQRVNLQQLRARLGRELRHPRQFVEVVMGEGEDEPERDPRAAEAVEPVGHRCERAGTVPHPVVRLGNPVRPLRFRVEADPCVSCAEPLATVNENEAYFRFPRMCA
jgi:hypothetical protein